MYNYEIVPSLQKELNKLFKKDKKLYEMKRTEGARAIEMNVGINRSRSPKLRL